MAKCYYSPNIVALGAAEVMTKGDLSGPIFESPVGNARKTTHHLLDL